MPDFYVFNFIPLVIVQGIVLHLMKWGSWPRSLFDSLLMNSITTLGILLNLAPTIYTAGPFGLALFGTYSTLMEGVTLTFLDRHHPKRVWLTVLAANGCGCLVLAAEAIAGLARTN